jgi:hypothetical protein
MGDPALRDKKAVVAFNLWCDRLAERLQDQEGLRLSEELQLYLVTLGELSIEAADFGPTFSSCKPVSSSILALERSAQYDVCHTS